MTDEERELLGAVFDLSNGQSVLIPFGDVAIRLETSVTAVRTLSALLRSRNLALVTFGGIQLTGAGVEQAKLQHAE
jgi:hypothetical protein